MDPDESSSQFVRLLKSSSDPPIENGPLKIEIAEKALSDASFYVPRKAQIISDWLVNRLLKDSKTLDAASSVLDVRYWALLSQAITSNDAASNHNVHNWLVPLLNRVSFVQIITFLFQSLKLPLGVQETQLVVSVNTCLTVIWPSVALRSNTDSLLELFGALLALSPQKCENDDFVYMALRLVASFRSSLESCSTKKKIYEAFMKHHLSSWIDCVMNPDSSSPLIKDIYNAGADILFNLDILRLIVGSGLEILSDSLSVLNRGTVLLLLPQLFSTAVENIKKYRGTLFHSNQSDTSLNDVRSSALRFFVACETLLDNQHFQREAWTSRVALLLIIQREGLVYHEATAGQLFSKTISLALHVLDTQSDDIAVTSQSIDCLCHLANIDYSLVSPALPSILPAILRISHCHENLWSLFDLLVDYHAKTRTIDIYLGLLFSSLSSPHFTSHHYGPRKLYEIASSSAVLHPKHLEHLSQAITIFLTEALLTTTIKSTLDAVKSSWQSLQDCDTEERPKKKKKHADGNSTSSPNRETSSLVFSLTVKLASVVLASLPSRLAVTTRTEVLIMIEDFRDSTLRHAISKSLKVMRHDDKNWSTAIATAALLQLDYTFSLQPQLRPNPSFQEKHFNKLLELEPSPLVPELSLEIFRTLLSYSSTGQFGSPLLFEKILTYLSEDLHDDARQNFIAFLHGHWLPAIDSQCSTSQVEKFTWNLIIQQHNNGYHLENLFGSADFWELPNFRAALLNCADSITSFLDHHGDDMLAVDSQQVHSILMVYKILLLVPAEYYTRPLKISFINRAAAADILLVNNTKTASFDCLLVLRVFISRSLRAIEIPPRSLHNLLLHLLDSSLIIPPDSEDFLTATLDVCEACLLSMLRMQDSTEMTLQILGSMAQSLGSDSFTMQTMPARFFVRTVDLLSRHFVAEHMPSEVQLELRRNHDVLSAKLFSRMDMSQRSTESFEGEGSLIEGWRRTMLLGRWLGVPDRSVPPIAAGLLARLTQSLSNYEESEVIRRHRSSAVETFYLLLEEFYSCQLDRLKVLETILLAYVQIYYSVGMDVLPLLDEPFSQMCAALSITEFEHITQKTFKLLSDSFACVVHLWTILIQNSPKNAFQMTQAFVMRCLNVLIDHSGYVVESAGLRQEALHFLVHRCTERAAALRLIELNSIWALVSKMLTFSANHADQTTFTVFTDIVTIISTLVRLRRDLVVLSLSHLGLALRQLVMLLRAPRPHLGGKQAALVGNTFPCWINVQHPLGPEQGKVLSRLLQTLSAKTVPKGHSTSAKLQRAASLAKPFSKHAAYVLQAYVDAMNDPLCILTAGVRKELEPGLFALCHMLSEQNRDSFMLSALDSSGKAIMKSLWKEYEKQHYAGTG